MINSQVSLLDAFKLHFKVVLMGFLFWFVVGGTEREMETERDDRDRQRIEINIRDAISWKKYSQLPTDHNATYPVPH